MTVSRQPVPSLNLFPTPAETIAGLAPLVRAGRRSCRDLLHVCLDRIDDWEPQIHAWVAIDRDKAVEQARQLDEELAAGRCRGPLHGVPVGIKDIIDVAGLVTAAGFPPWAARAPAERDAPVVRRLRDAGAIILGKTVTTQFAAFDPPITRNPWNLERTPGGSSSGSAAAVACGMCYGALGTQTGGSITRPAAYCGIAGCKPSFGAVSLDGIVPVAPSLDHVGPLARCVDDLAILLAAIADESPVDAAAAAACELAADSGPHGEPPRLGRVGGLFDEKADPQARAALDAALNCWTAAGAAICKIELPRSFDDVLRCHRVVMSVEAAAYHERQFRSDRDRYAPAIRSLVEEGLGTPAAEYARCLQHQRELRSAAGLWLTGLDALVTPAATGPAPEHTTTGDPAVNAPWSYTGLPTVSFPLSLAAEGLPLAAQLIGSAGDERRLFRAASWCARHVRP